MLNFSYRGIFTIILLYKIGILVLLVLLLPGVAETGFGSLEEYLVLFGIYSLILPIILLVYTIKISRSSPDKKRRIIKYGLIGAAVSLIVLFIQTHVVDDNSILFFSIDMLILGYFIGGILASNIQWKEVMIIPLVLFIVGPTISYCLQYHYTHNVVFNSVFGKSIEPQIYNDQILFYESGNYNSITSINSENGEKSVILSLGDHRIQSFLFTPSIVFTGTEEGLSIIIKDGENTITTKVLETKRGIVKIKRIGDDRIGALGALGDLYIYNIADFSREMVINGVSDFQVVLGNIYIARKDTIEIYDSSLSLTTEIKKSNNSMITHIFVDKNAEKIVIGDKNRIVSLIDLNSKNLIHEIIYTGDWTKEKDIESYADIESLLITPDDSKLLIGDYFGVGVYDITSGKMIEHTRKIGGAYRFKSLIYKQGILGIGNGKLKLLDSNLVEQTVYELEGVDSIRIKFDVVNNGKNIVIGGEKKISIYNIASGGIKEIVIPQNKCDIHSYKYDPNKRIIVNGCRNKTFIYNMSGKLITETSNDEIFPRDDRKDSSGYWNTSHSRLEQGKYTLNDDYEIDIDWSSFTIFKNSSKLERYSGKIIYRDSANIVFLSNYDGGIGIYDIKKEKLSTSLLVFDTNIVKIFPSSKPSLIKEINTKKLKN